MAEPEAEAWPRLKELHDLLLAGKSAEQRRLLRLHEETGFVSSDEREIQFRRELDAELARIADAEFRAQCNAPGPGSNGGALPYFSALLQDSPAFVQYLNVYLYFSVRFAAGRIFAACSPKQIDEAECNEPIAALPPPPVCQEGWNNAGAVEEFLELARTADLRDPVEKALRFLDGFTATGEKLEARNPAEGEETHFELWLKRLYFKHADSAEEQRKFQEKQAYFADLADAMLAWARSRYQFYTALERRSLAKRSWVDEWERKTSEVWKEGLWTVNNPIAARCALVDFYWLAKILRADVSQSGEVTYRERSWLYLLAIRRAMEPDIKDEARTKSKAETLRIEEVLRSAFGYACDLIQNAVEIANECADWNANPEKYAFPPAAITDPGPKEGSWRPEAWREVEDREHIEITVHRKERDHQSIPGSVRINDGPCPESEKPSGWSRRVWTGEQLDNVIGLAFSGGGIRSATFNLGVLQKLQELDLLRHIDYLSTVSGGGYIGSWLVGNVRRTRYWLSRMTNWDASIEHLRRYSNYLAPHTGILSPDTWSIGLTWVRNALLIQITAFVWLAVILMFTLDLKKLVFEWARDGQTDPMSAPHWALVGSMVVILAAILFFLSHERLPRTHIARGIFVRGNGFTIGAASLAWFGCFLTAGLLWGQARSHPDEFTEFSKILIGSFQDWSKWVILLFCSSIALIALFSVGRHKLRKPSGVIAAAILVPAVAYLALCGELRIFGALIENALSQQCPYLERLDWVAFVVGPFISMVGIALAIAIFIGLVGRAAPDWTREWWTRYGAWIAMIGTVAFIVVTAAVVAPWGVLQLTQLRVKWPVISGAVGWIGSTISGLLAGKSSKTGEGGERSKTLEIIARVGGFLFIVGAVAVSSTVVYLILREALGDDAESYAYNLQRIIEIQAGALGIAWMWILPVLTAGLGWVFSKRFDLNTFSLNQFYRNRLVRCYLGATRWQPGKRREHPFTGFDQKDDILLSDLRALRLSETPSAVPAKDTQNEFCGENFRGPFPIINCTLNLGGSSDLTIHTRQSASFSVTPLFSGATRKKVGYAPTPPNEEARCFAGGATLGEAISVSGAAASPNMGYNTSPLVSFLMTLFNVRLGWWFPNPAKSAWYKDRPPSGRYLGSELLGIANENRDFVNISDGGHFENLGVYELIRRKARVIVTSDAECDETLTFGSLGKLVRIAETDFGAKIELDVSSIRKEPEIDRSRAHCAVGKITYSNGTHGYLIYIKSSITGDEDIGVAQYRSGHPTFPHESTGNQFYSEDQFEAYRRLGYHITDRTFRDAKDEATLFEIAAKLYDIWAPAGFMTTSFLQHTTTLDRILDRLRGNEELSALFSELTGGHLAQGSLTPAQDAACMELIQLMENVFLDLRLDDFWDHPDNRGWVLLFAGFARSPKFQESWNRHRCTYGIRFEYFCSQRLGLERDRPIIRV
ncbi:MAG: hypothetical protein JO097_21045 [Acidobacteriaceae bacterium]|nr:hypothetical protein [Acidobacteriaceae bacterium]MBV9295897.1 hypothetical protein [Acidobacteriaceae bacterium]MBV9766751.1 hypothetical protein [Acidobacteriaceae bacterium]